MKQNLLYVLLICSGMFYPNSTLGQYNYISNPSFEVYDSIDYYYPDSTYWRYYYPVDWFTPTLCGFSWYKNEHLNFVDTTGGSGISPYGVPQNPWDYCWPVEGSAYALMNIYKPMGVNNDGIRMYLENILELPLEANKDYCLSFFVTLGDSAQLSIDQIGAYFSMDTISNYYPPSYIDSCFLIYSPQITSPPGEFFDIRNQWYKISGIYHAMGGERFLTIGNFHGPWLTNYILVPGSSTTYGPDAAYNIDLVTLYECDSVVFIANAGNDTTICLGDTIQLGGTDSLNGYSFVWTPMSAMSDSSIANPLVAPQETITYFLQQSYYSNYVSTDAITITVIDCHTDQNSLFIPNIFSPNGDGFNDVFYVKSNDVTRIDVKVFNRWGNLVFESIDPAQGWDGRFHGMECAEGVYFYTASVTFMDGTVEVKKGNVTIVR